jgi:glyceraldehyde-3-phosphate dehydrogenase (NAD(P))
VALWSNILSVDGTELCYNYMVDNQAIVIPETIDAIRALASSEESPAASMQMTNMSLGIGEDRLSL